MIIASTIMTYAPKKAMCPCIAVIIVPWVHLFTEGQVCANPRMPAPSAEKMVLPSVQWIASRFGCASPERRIAI